MQKAIPTWVAVVVVAAVIVVVALIFWARGRPQVQPSPVGEQPTIKGMPITARPLGR